MVHSRNAVIALAVVLIAPASGLAGPIEWGYLGYVHPDTGSGRLRIGSIPGAEGGSQDVIASLRGEFVDGPFMAGSQRFAVASLLDIDVGTPSEHTPPLQDQFFIDISISDNASGKSALFTVRGRGVYLGDDLLLDRRVRLELLDQSRSLSVTLGGNRYDFAFSVTQGADSEGHPDHISTIWADVTVASATPEPATLALAGLGLGGLGVVRRLRRT